MLKTLIKKQLLELNKSFFVDRKTGKGKSARSATFSIVLFILLMIFAIGGMFCYMSYSMRPLITYGMSWLYFAIMGATAALFGVFGSVFNTYSSLYDAKDNDLLLSMPIPVRDIMAARLIGVYLMGLMYSGVVVIPAVGVYFITAHPGISGITAVIMAVMVTVLVLILSCILGWVVAKIAVKLKNKSIITVIRDSRTSQNPKIAVKLKNKSIITVIVSIAFLGGYYYVYFRANEIITGIVATSSAVATKVRTSAYPLYIFGKAFAGDVLPTIIISLIILALLAATWLIMSRTFLKLVTSSGKTAKTVYKEKTVKQQGTDRALLRREINHFLSSPSYMLNCSLGALFMIAVAVFSLIKSDWFIGVVTRMDEDLLEYAPTFACLLLCLLSSMNILTAPAISLEGKSLWIARSLPVTSWQILRAKLKLHMLFTAVPALICSICFCIALKPELLTAVVMIILPQIFTLLCAVSGLRVNIRMPNLTWSSESGAVKQSLGIMLAMCLGWAYIIVLIVVYLFAVQVLPNVFALMIATAVIAIITAISFSRLKRKGVKRFETL